MARKTAKDFTDHLSAFEVRYPVEKGYIARRLLVDGWSVSDVFNEVQTVLQEAEPNQYLHEKSLKRSRMHVTLKVVLALLAGVTVLDACNEAICAPLVSKCMLINCCDCEMSDLKNCSCCRDCQVCLSKLYTECCSCVGLCPPPDPTDEMTKSSSVEELPDPIPDLFNVLTEEVDHQQRWTTFTYAVDLDKLSFSPGTATHDKGVKIITVGKADERTVLKEESERILGIKNCTVAFFSDCMSMAKCKASCKSMGAAKYRWFHEHGCCQCVGSSCYDYGLSEPKCLRCPEVQHLEFSDHSYRKWVQKDEV